MSRRAAALLRLRLAIAPLLLVVLVALAVCLARPASGGVSPRVRGFTHPPATGALEAKEATNLHRPRLVDPADLKAHQQQSQDKDAQAPSALEYTTPHGQRVIIEQQAPSTTTPTEHAEGAPSEEDPHVQQLLAHDSQAYLVSHGGVELNLDTVTEADIEALVASGQLSEADAQGFFDSLKKKASAAASALKAKVAPALDSLKAGAKSLGSKIGAGLKSAAKSAASALKDQAAKQLAMRKARVQYQQEARRKPAFLKKYESSSTGPDPLRRRKRTPEQIREQEAIDAEWLRGSDLTKEPTMHEMIQQAHEQWAGALPALHPTAPKKLGAYVVSSTGAGFNTRLLGENLAMAGANALNNWLN